MSDPGAQAIPEDATCPHCGGDPVTDSVNHRLSALGYLHDE